jgi:hypothetical protein
VHRSDEDVAAATARLIRALATRLAEDDPTSAPLLLQLDAALVEAWAFTVDGWRASGWTDGQIGRELGVSKQAIAQRFPRTSSDVWVVG